MPKSIPINQYKLKIIDSKIAETIDNQMNFYGLMDVDKSITRDKYTTSWTEGRGNHEYEDKTFTFTELNRVKVRLHLNTPHDESDKKKRGEETLEIILTKQKGGSLSKREIKDAIRLIEKTTGTRGLLPSFI